MFGIMKAICGMPINKQTANYKIFLRILSSLEYHNFLIQQGIVLGRIVTFCTLCHLNSYLNDARITDCFENFKPGVASVSKSFGNIKSQPSVNLDTSSYSVPINRSYRVT